jgi:ABC-type multidrug transport system permease subunit
VDVADFLQEIPTAEGARYINKDFARSSKRVPRTTESLVAAFKASEVYQRQLEEIEKIDNGKLHDVLAAHQDPEAGDNRAPAAAPVYDWPADFKEPYAGSMWFHFKLTLERQATLTMRDKSFIISRIMQRLLLGGIAGSLFCNISPSDTATMNGFLFFCVLFNALSAFPMMPLVFAQKAVYYKHVEANFYPTMVYIAAQSLVLLPLFIIEGCIFGSIMYWSAGLSIEVNGSRFLAFILINLVFAIANSQLFRLFACVFPDATVANPIAGIVVVLMVLFSGFIQPKSEISYGWMWFYWINPTSWALSAVTINQLKSSAYNNEISVCDNPPACTVTVFERSGDYILEQYGNKTSQRWIWYSLAVIIALFWLYFFASYLALRFIRTESAKPLPLKSTVTDDDQEYNERRGKKETNRGDGKGEYAAAGNGEGDANGDDNKGVPFTPVTLAFKEIWYTVTLRGGEELDLLKEVSGFFKPGTVTALMGSSGAGNDLHSIQMLFSNHPLIYCHYREDHTVGCVVWSQEHWKNRRLYLRQR